MLFFDPEADYRQGDETLNAMDSGETPGQRTGVAKYEVAMGWPNRAEVDLARYPPTMTVTAPSPTARKPRSCRGFRVNAAGAAP